MRWVALIGLLVACGGGGHTVEQLESASAGVNAFQKWDEAQPKIEGALGAADKTDGDTLKWYAHADGGCMALSLTRMGDVVGSVGITEEPCP